MRRQTGAGAVELPILKEALSGREIGDDGSGLISGPGKGRCSPGFVVVFEEPCQPVLLFEACPEMYANFAWIPIPKAIGEALVVAVVETLLVQLMFEIPVSFGQEREAWIRPAHRGDRLCPEGSRRHLPGASEDLRQLKHRHIAAQAIAESGDGNERRYLSFL